MAEINDLLSNISNIKTDIKSAIENKGQNVTNFASYPNAISNIVSGGGGVKQYDSLENMYADVSNAHNGDLATVYASSQAGITETTEFQVATFPETVVLDTVLSDYVDIRFQAVDESQMFDCWGQLDSSMFSMDCYAETEEDFQQYQIEYESQDGITYTRTRFMKNSQEISGNEIDFGMLIKFGSRWEESEFNSAISKFIISGFLVFDGLFQYNGVNFSLLSNTGLNANIENIWSGKFYGSNAIQNGTLSKITNLSLDELKNRVNLYSNISSLKLNEDVDNVAHLFSEMSDIYTIPYVNISKVTNTYGMFSSCYNLKNIPNLDTSNVTGMGSMFEYCSNLTTIPNLDTSNVTSLSGMFANCSNLTTIPNFNTSNVTSVGSMFYGCYNLINIPNFDTSKANSFSFIFTDCYNLTAIPNFNTSNVTSMQYAFSGCQSIISIPNLDTSNVKNMTNVFAGCRNLIEIPNLDVANVTIMVNAFKNCSNLVDIAMLNLHSVTNMMDAFLYCNNLSSNAYANIANMLPESINLSNYFLSNMGLNIENFTLEQKQILGNKKYVEAIQYVINSSRVSSYWNIYYA